MGVYSSSGIYLVILECLCFLPYFSTVLIELYTEHLTFFGFRLSRYSFVSSSVFGSSKNSSSVTTENIKEYFYM